MAEDGRHVAQDAASRNLQSWMGVHLRCGGLQSGADEEPRDSSLRINPGRSVPERQEIGDSGPQAPRNACKKLVGEAEASSPSIFFSSLLGERTWCYLTECGTERKTIAYRVQPELQSSIAARRITGYPVKQHPPNVIVPVVIK